MSDRPFRYRVRAFCILVYIVLLVVSAAQLWGAWAAIAAGAGAYLLASAILQEPKE